MNSTKINELDWAIHWASLGLPVFPVHPDSKLPAIQGWPEAATCDLKQVELWWLANPAYNIGCHPGAAGYAVLDVDVKGGKPGMASLADAETRLGALPDTLRTRTRTGGLHIWLQCPDVGNSAGKLGAGLDVRGVGGFVLMPGSTIEGRAYTVETDAAIAEAPEAWRTAFAAPRERKEAPSGVELDSDRSLRRARDYLAECVSTGDVAIEGQGGNDRTFRLFAYLKDLGVSRDTALDMAGAWNEACSPPWETEEFTRIADNAYAYGANDAGIYANELTAEEAFAGLLTDEPEHAEARQPSRFQFLTCAEQDRLPEPSWLVEGLIPKRSTVLLYGAPGTFKSFAALDVALALASARSPLGLKAVKVAMPVVYMAGEGPHGIARRRRPAWNLARGVSPDEAAKMPFYLCGAVPLVRSKEDLAAFISALKASGICPALVIIDTAARAMAGLDENSARDTGLLVEAADAIKRAFECTVLVVHHAGKDTSRGARGSSAIEGGFDTFVKVEAEKAVLALTLTVEKQKDEDPGEPLHLKGRHVGASLVFDPISAAEFGELTQPADEISQRMVTDALRTLGPGNHMTNHLASTILHLRGEEPEDGAEAKAARDSLAKRLKRHAQSGRNLAAFANRSGSGQTAEWRWAIPEGVGL